MNLKLFFLVCSVLFSMNSLANPQTTNPPASAPTKWFNDFYILATGLKAQGTQTGMCSTFQKMYTFKGKKEYVDLIPTIHQEVANFTPDKSNYLFGVHQPVLSNEKDRALKALMRSLGADKSSANQLLLLLQSQTGFSMATGSSAYMKAENGKQKFSEISFMVLIDHPSNHYMIIGSGNCEF